MSDQGGTTRLHLDLFNFTEPQYANYRYVLTSPRSLEACSRLGIKPADLLPKSFAKYQEENNIDEDTDLAAEYREYEATEERRAARLAAAREEREAIVTQENYRHPLPLATVSPAKSSRHSSPAKTSAIFASRSATEEMVQADLPRQENNRREGSSDRRLVEPSPSRRVTQTDAEVDDLFTSSWQRDASHPMPMPKSAALSTSLTRRQRRRSPSGDSSGSDVEVQRQFSALLKYSEVPARSRPTLVPRSDTEPAFSSKDPPRRTDADLPHDSHVARLERKLAQLTSEAEQWRSRLETAERSRPRSASRLPPSTRQSRTMTRRDQPTQQIRTMDTAIASIPPRRSFSATRGKMGLSDRALDSARKSLRTSELIRDREEEVVRRREDALATERKRAAIVAARHSAALDSRREKAARGRLEKEMSHRMNFTKLQEDDAAYRDLLAELIEAKAARSKQVTNERVKAATRTRAIARMGEQMRQDMRTSWGADSFDKKVLRCNLESRLDSMTPHQSKKNLSKFSLS